MKATAWIALLFIFSFSPIVQAAGNPLVLVKSADATVSGGRQYSTTLETEPGYYMVEVENRGVDVISETFMRDERLLRTGSWRDREGIQRGIFKTGSPGTVTIIISSVETFASPGQVLLTVYHIPDPDLLSATQFQAELEATEGIGYHLTYYFDGVDNRESAVSLLLDAISLWKQEGDSRELSRLYFELGALYRSMGKFQEGRQALEKAIGYFRETGDMAGVAATENSLGLLLWRSGDLDSAKDNFEFSLAIRQKAEEAYYIAQLENNLALVERDQGNLVNARLHLQKAFEINNNSHLLDEVVGENNTEIFKGLSATGSDVPFTAVLLNNMALIQSEQGDIDGALITATNAVNTAKALGNTALESQYTVNLALLNNMIANYAEAVRLILPVIDNLKSPGQEFWLGLALDGIGQAYTGLGDFETARDYFQQAISIDTTNISPADIVKYRIHLAQNYLLQGKLQEGQQILQNAIEQAQQAGLPLWIGASLNTYGEVLYEAENYDLALDTYLKAYEVLKNVKLSQAGFAQARAGRAAFKLGDETGARDHYEQAIDMFKAMDGREFQSWTMSQLAVLEAGSDLPNALSLSTEALALLESVRSDISSPLQRTDFLRNRRDIYENHIRLLLADNRIDEAWLTSERIRARTFSDLLAEKDINGFTDERPENLTERSSLLRQINYKSALLENYDNKPAAHVSQGDLREEISELERRLQIVEGEIRRQRPEFTTSGDTTAVSPARFQSLLDDDTAVVEYLLGDEKSYAWILTRDNLDVVELENAGTIFDAVNAGYDSLKSPTWNSESAANLRTLSDLLIKPIAPWLDHEHLVIIPDGSLSFIPFDVLPHPEADEAPLVATHEVSYAPSASVLFQLTRESNQLNGPGPEGIAIIADPVFSTADNRYNSRGAETESSTELAVTRSNGSMTDIVLRSDNFSRLPYSALEAREIYEQFSDRNRFMATGLEANRELLLGNDLARYRIIHLATHGVIDADQPYLSGLVMSRFDGNYNPQPSFVRAIDISYMNLNADLVVLSACETAMGKSVVGEGTLGLTRAFFLAGAKQVISSLWQVPDRATSELMSYFYEEALNSDITTAEALRRAKNRLRENPRWAAPFYWAGFIVQGDRDIKINQ